MANFNSTSTIYVSIEDIDKIRTNGIAHMQNIVKRCEQRLPVAADHLLTLMVARTPFKTGKLRDSAQHTGLRRDGADAVVGLSFGNPEAYYAIVVHERLDVRHPTGQAKFMESVLQEEHENVTAIIGG